jgi:arylsulfatase A-like enzyme
VYDPSSPAPGQTRKEAVQSIDVTASILDYAGVAIPSHIMGNSMKPLVEGKTIPWREYTFSEALWCTAFGMPRIESIRGKGWKYIRYYKVDRNLFSPEARGMEKYQVSNKQAVAYQSWLTHSIEGEKPDYEELFHLETDPGETVNLMDVPALMRKTNSLRGILQSMVEAARSDPFPLVELESDRSDYLRWKMKHD